MDFLLNGLSACFVANYFIKGLFSIGAAVVICLLALLFRSYAKIFFAFGLEYENVQMPKK